MSFQPHLLEEPASGRTNVKQCDSNVEIRRSSWDITSDLGTTGSAIDWLRAKTRIVLHRNITRELYQKCYYMFCWNVIQVNDIIFFF